MRELFIYYRVRLDTVEAARAVARAFQARLALRHPGLNVRLMRRNETSASVPTQTWMETYAIDDFMRQPEGISAELQADIEAEASAMADYIEGERHTEAFVPCAS